MTLKTLKDIKLRPFDSGNTIEEIREAAKEWITHLWGEVGVVAVKGKRENVIPATEMMKLNAQIDWINRFFNLEAEDE